MPKYFIHNSWFLYAISCFVFIASFTMAVKFEGRVFIQSLASVPAVGALLGVLFTLWRDQRKHERAKELLIAKHDFVLAFTSHMAKAAFDKYSSFTEKYISKLYEGLQNLKENNGPMLHAKDLAQDLHKIRIKYLAWMSKETEDMLLPLERTLMHMAATHNLLDNDIDMDRRDALIEELYKYVRLVQGSEPTNDLDEKQIQASAVISELRNLLGVQEISEIRIHTLNKAAGRLRTDDTGH